ncbi:MAG TPA: alpha/beta fold hydrolase [Candidatus Saccharimonadales bacterium]|nr:alpha/beta fold hydrolase [Candidatus Saccharimonadales bacterium]
MTKTTPANPADYIVPLNMNGLDGRMLKMPPPEGKNREILLIYGHHAMLERWWGLVQNLNELGGVTMPDMPGFGGMDSFYSIGRKPTIDAFADYLAAFIKLRYKRKRVTIVGISFGFVVVTRMLQRYPELVKKVDLLVSIVGFMHHDDFLFSRRQRFIFRRVTRLLATQPVATTIRYVGLNRFAITFLSKRMPNSKKRFIEVTPEEFMDTMEFEVKLWQSNDVRTHWRTTSEFLNVDNCGKKINLPVYHVVSTNEHYFDNEIVKQHMLVVFSDYHRYEARSKAHTPSILADKKAMRAFVPAGLRRVLNQKG